MNQRQLECFFAVADTRHFGRAAQSLNLGRATVSEAVSALERALGAPLFARTSRRVSLTPFGERFLVSTREPFEQLSAAYTAARRVHHRRQELVLGHTPELGQLLLPHLLACPTEAGGDPGWSPRRMHTHEQLDALLRDEIDLAVRWDARVPPPLRAVTLARCPYVVVVRAVDELAQREAVTATDLADRPIMITPRRYNRFLSTRLEAAFLSAGVAPRHWVEFPHFEDVVFRVAASGGTGVHPATLCALTRSPGVVFRPLTEPNLAADVVAVFAEPVSEPVEALVGALRTAVDSALAGSAYREVVTADRREPGS